jgi:hypothetical protein
MTLITCGSARAPEPLWSDGSGGLAVIDPATASLVSRIPLQAHPEGFQLDAGKRRVFANVPDARQIAVIDMAASQQTTTWLIPDDLRANFPMGLDASRAMAAVAFRSPPRFVTFDVNTGKPTGVHKTCGDADDIFWDAKRRRVYVSCGDGRVDVWQQEARSFGRNSDAAVLVLQPAD